MTTRALVAELTAVLGGARHEARFIVDEALDVRPGGPRPDVVPAAQAAAARAMATRRAAEEPLQYILGHWPFRGLDLRVDPRVLIPRPETEQVVEVALGEARRLLGAFGPGRAGLVAVDAGTGSGAIALALATELGAGAVDQVWATDSSAGALEVAAGNLLAAGPRRRRCAPRVELVEGSWLTPLPEGLRSTSTSWSRTRLTSPRTSGPGWTPRCGPSPGRPSSWGPGRVATRAWPTWRPCS